MGTVQLCLLAMDTQRLVKNLSRKFLLETIKISPFKYTVMVTVEPGFNSEFYRMDCNWVSFILI